MAAMLAVTLHALMVSAFWSKSSTVFCNRKYSSFNSPLVLCWLAGLPASVLNVIWTSLGGSIVGGEKKSGLVPLTVSIYQDFFHVLF